MVQTIIIMTATTAIVCLTCTIITRIINEYRNYTSKEPIGGSRYKRDRDTNKSKDDIGKYMMYDNVFND